MKKVFLPLFVALISIQIQPASAMTGKDLLEICSRYSDTYLSGVCDGYIGSSIDNLALDKAAGQLPSYYCLPNNVSREELRRITLKVIRESRNIQKTTAFAAVYNALVYNYPCQE